MEVVELLNITWQVENGQNKVDKVINESEICFFPLMIL